MCAKIIILFITIVVYNTQCFDLMENINTAIEEQQTNYLSFFKRISEDIIQNSQFDPTFKVSLNKDQIDSFKSVEDIREDVYRTLDEVNQENNKMSSILKLASELKNVNNTKEYNREKQKLQKSNNSTRNYTPQPILNPSLKDTYKDSRVFYSVKHITTPTPLIQNVNKLNLNTNTTKNNSRATNLNFQNNRTTINVMKPNKKNSTINNDKHSDEIDVNWKDKSDLGTGNETTSYNEDKGEDYVIKESSFVGDDCATGLVKIIGICLPKHD